MKWLFYGLVALGAFSSMATYGASNKAQKQKYLILTVAIWLLVFVLANVIL